MVHFVTSNESRQHRGCNILPVLQDVISRDESLARRASLRRHKTDQVTADDLIEKDSNNDMVFAPIINMTDDHVWTILRIAGEHPLQLPRTIKQPIFSYAPNHRLLHLIYSDSKDGSCPTSAKRVKGDKQKAGGCGGSARTGCYLCAKSISDKSGEAQVRQERHSVISGNILKVRNYIMHVAQDIKYRTWHSRAVDETTGAVALQPNMLNAKTLDKLIWLLSQATWDDVRRAERFSELVKSGQEMLDPGFADIVNDKSLDRLDRKELASVYRKYAVKPLIKPMSMKLALYISAVHSRDGVRLPPFRALHVWLATSKGERVEYPDVNPELAKVDEIPDPVMIVPRSHVFSQIPYTGSGVLDLEQAEGCEGESKLIVSQVPAKIAKYYLPENEQSKLAGLAPSDTVFIQGLATAKLLDKYRAVPLARSPKVQCSRRKIKRVSRKQGGYKVIERGRTSVDHSSFGLRNDVPNLQHNICVEMPIFKPSGEREYGTWETVQEEDGFGYRIDDYYLTQWMDYSGVESALEKHDELVHSRKKFGEHIYHYGGLGPFEDLLRWGVLCLNKSSKANASRILKRTAYFNSFGLFGLDDDSIEKLAAGVKVHPENSYRARVQANVEMNIAEILDMPRYRSYKARILAGLRQARNEKRAQLKANYKDFWSDPVAASIEQFKSAIEAQLPDYRKGIELMYLYNALLDANVSSFDGVDFKTQYHINEGLVNYLKALTSDFSLAIGLFDRSLASLFKGNPQYRKLFIEAQSCQEEKLRIAEEAVLVETLNIIKTSKGRRGIYYMVDFDDKIRHQIVNRLEYQVAQFSRLDINNKSVFKRTFRLDDTLAETRGVKW